jgi:hypothetical protein
VNRLASAWHANQKTDSSTTPAQEPRSRKSVASVLISRLLLTNAPFGCPEPAVRIGEGGVSFSKEFLVVTGDEPEPDGTTFCDMHKLLGLFPSLRLRQYHVLWYGKTSAGGSLFVTYKGDEPNVTATLTLNEDHSFAQTLVHNDVAKHANGTWNQDSNGTIWFSKQFLKTSGESLSANELASSINPQGSNLQIEISVAQRVAEPIFHKHLGF